MAKRIAPLPNPSREYPFEPSQYGDDERIAPLPYAYGVGESYEVSSNYSLTMLLVTSISVIYDPNNPTGGTCKTATCSRIADVYCVPTAEITLEDAPIATLRCYNS